MLRGDTAALRIETGGCNGLKREERFSRQSTMGEMVRVKVRVKVPLTLKRM